MKKFEFTASEERWMFIAICTARAIFGHAGERLLFWVAALFFGTWLLLQTPYGRDDTDPDRWGPRSGLAPLTDAKTGCQYLSGGTGVTPRLTANGEHMGCRP